MSLLNQTWRRLRTQFANRRTFLVAAIVVGLLLVELALPRLLRYGGTTTWLTALIGLACIVVAARRPFLALAILLCYAQFAAYLRFQGLSNTQSLFKDLAALGLVGLGLVRMVIQRRKWVRTSLDIPLLVFLALAAVNVLRGPTLLRGVLGLKVVAVYIPVYFLVANEPPTKRQLRSFLWVFLIVGAVTALYGLYQAATFSQTSLYDQQTTYAASPPYALQIEGQSFLAGRRFGQVRIFSTFTDSGVFSLFLVMSIMLALGLQRDTSSRNGRLALWAIIILMAANLPFTLTRLGWVGLLVGWGVHLLLSPNPGRRRWLLLGLVVVVVLILTLGGSLMQQVLKWSFSEEDLSFQARQGLIGWAYRMIFVEQIQGCGLGSQPDAADLATRVTKTYQPPYTCFWRGNPINGADTAALSVGVQMGLPGFLTYFAIFAVLWYQGAQVYRRLTEPLLKGVAAGILAYLAVITISDFFAGSLQAYPLVDLYFWFFAGLLLSLERIEQGIKKQEAGGGEQGGLA